MAASRIALFHTCLRKPDLRRFLDWLRLRHPRKPKAQERQLAQLIAAQPEIPTADMQAALGLESGPLRQVQARLAEDFRAFYAYRYLEEHPVLRRILALEYLAERHDAHLLRLELREAARQLDKLPWRDGSYYERKYQLIRLEHQVNVLQRDPASQQSLPALQAAQAHHTAYEQIRMACTAHDARRRGKPFHLPPALETLARELSAYQPEPPDPVLALYQATYAFLKEDKTVHVPARLWEAFDTHAPLILRKERVNLFSFLQNDLLTQINEDHSPATSAFALDRYQKALQEELLYEEDEHLLQRVHLHNLVQLALRVKQVALAQTYLTDLLPLVPAAEQEETQAFLRGLIAIEQADYREARRCFARTYQIGSLARQVHWYYLKAQYLGWCQLPAASLEATEDAERMLRDIDRERHRLAEQPSPHPATLRAQQRLSLLRHLLLVRQGQAPRETARAAIAQAALPDRMWFEQQVAA